MAKSTISEWQFSSSQTVNVYQRVIGQDSAITSDYYPLVNVYKKLFFK